MKFRDIPGYIILLGLAVLGLAGFLASRVSFHLHHVTPFESETGYQTIDQLIADKIAFDEQVERSILELGPSGDAFRKANTGDAEAQYQVGNVYFYGLKGQQRDLGKAAEWFKKSAAQNYAPAEYEVGRVGNVYGPTALSVTWFHKSADHGYKWAQIHLGEIYMHFMAASFGVKQDFAEAYYWLSLGTRDEDKDSQFVTDRESAKGNLTKQQIDAVDKRVQDWLDAHPTAAIPSR